MHDDPRPLLRAGWTRVAECVRQGAVSRKFGGMPTATIWSEADLRLRFVAELRKSGVPLEDMHLEATDYGVGPIDFVLADADACMRACQGSPGGKFRPGEFPLDAAIEFAVLQDKGAKDDYGDPKLQKVLNKLLILRHYYPNALLAAAFLVRHKAHGARDSGDDGVDLWLEAAPFPD
jgi:hypothetical protein